MNVVGETLYDQHHPPTQHLYAITIVCPITYLIPQILCSKQVLY